MKIDTHPYRKLEKKIIKHISSFMTSIVVSSDHESFMKRFDIHTSKRQDGCTRLYKSNCTYMDIAFINQIIDFIKNNCHNDEIKYDIKFFKTPHNNNGVILKLFTDYLYDPLDFETYLRLKNIKL